MYGEEQLPNDAKMVCSYDVAGPYEVDEGALYLLSDGTYLFRWASGCSCWDGSYSTERHVTFEDFVQMCWMSHGPSFEFEPGFEHLKEVAERNLNGGWSRIDGQFS